jgi:hypothetical protein
MTLLLLQARYRFRQLLGIRDVRQGALQREIYALKSGGHAWW